MALPHWVRVTLGGISIKGYFTFSMITWNHIYLWTSKWLLLNRNNYMGASWGSSRGVVANVQDCRWNLEYAGCIPCWRLRLLQKKGVLGVTLNYIWSFLSLPLIPGPLWPGVVVSVRIPSMCQSLFSLFNSISNFVVYLMPKTPLYKNNSDTILSIAGRIRGFIHFQRIWVRKWTS